MSDVAIKIENLKKRYMLGAIGGRTLNAELQSWWARKRGKEDPNTQIGQDTSRYGETFWALDGINLEIRKGEAVGIIGANGAGKSTLLKILSRVTAPTEGDVWIDGRVASMLEVGTGFHGELTGRENIYMNGAILGMTRKEVDAKIESIIDFSECRQFIDTPVKRYSSGMYVKLAFAVASHLDAEIMVMDEVLAVGDMAFQKKCLGRMGDEAKSGRTVLYVSHNMATIRNLCARCIVLDKGKIIYDGETEKAVEKYLDCFAGILPTFYDLRNQKRPVFTMGGRALFESIEFLGKQAASFDSMEKISILVRWAELKKTDVFVRIVVLSAYGGAIGMVDSNTVLNQTHETFHASNLAFTFSCISPGKYGLRFELYKYDHGLEYQLDASPLIPFEIEKNTLSKYIHWHNNYWGHVIFSNMEIK